MQRKDSAKIAESQKHSLNQVTPPLPFLQKILSEQITDWELITYPTSG
jgi:hypothetical protein